jgi:hypothetical protein
MVEIGYVGNKIEAEIVAVVRLVVVVAAAEYVAVVVVVEETVEYHSSNWPQLA